MIPLTFLDGPTEDTIIYINPSHIITLMEAGDRNSTLVFTTGMQPDDEPLWVKENIHLVAALIVATLPGDPESISDTMNSEFAKSQLATS